MFFVFYFIKISKFALPGVMLICERTSKDRKKERKKERKIQQPLVICFRVWYEKEKVRLGAI